MIENIEKELERLKEENAKLKRELAALTKENATSFRDRYASDILVQIPDMLTVFDKDERVVEVVSGEHTNHVGRPSEELKGTHMSESITPEAYEALHNTFRKAYETKQYAMGLHSIDVLGERRFFENHCFPIADDHILVMCHDITERTNAKNLYSDLSRLTATILHHIPIAVYVIDSGDDMKYIYWNRMMEVLTGIPAADAIGKNEYEIWKDPAEIEKFVRQNKELLESGKPMKMQHTFINEKNGSRVMQIQKIVLNYEGRAPLILGIGYDISNLEEIEHNLVTDRIKAEKADRQKSAFLANMSHELRSPLTAIVGFAELLAYTEEEEEKEQYARIISLNSELLMQLINDILDTAKMEAGTLEYHKVPMNLTELCEGLSQTMLTRVQDGVSLIFDRPNRDVTVNEDPNRISQVLINLITNATKFTSQGEIRFGYNIEGEEIHFHVSDTGIGIPEDKIGKVFERFVKLNDRAQGTGLGLAICQMIVKNRGGRIWVESEFGKGSTFHFVIPLDEVAE